MEPIVHPKGDRTGLGWPIEASARRSQSDGPRAADLNPAVDPNPGLGWPTADGGLQALSALDQSEQGGLR